MDMTDNQRSKERIKAMTTVGLGDAIGLTRDISVSGIYFQTNLECAPGEVGSEISFSIDLDSPAGKLVMKCTGQIMRIDHEDELIGVAAKIVASKLELAN